MSALNTAFNSMLDMTLWFQVTQGTEFTLASIPAIAQSRWPWMRDSWESLKLEIIKNANSSSDPTTLLDQVNSFSTLVESQRSSINLNLNPLKNQANFQKFYLLFQSIFMNTLQLTSQEQRIIDNETTRVKIFTKSDFRKILKNIVEARDIMADTIGGSDPVYNHIYNHNSSPTLKSATPSDIQNMQQLQNAIKSVEYILANNFNSDNTGIDPFALARNNANNPNYNIVTSTAGFLTRMQYGDNLQSLANRFLHDPDRWMEIAICNGLKPPYIDEVGESIPLLSNGSNDQINIAATSPSGELNNEKFFINQIVFLQSDTIPFIDQRTILNIRIIPVSGEIVLELDGDPDLSKFLTIDNAYVRVFKPNTTNSQFFIMIPTPGRNAPSTINETPWFLKSKAQDEKQVGIDLAVDTNGDLIFTSGGDLSLSYGLANAIQAANMKFVVERGTLNRHNTYGLTNVIGATNLDDSTIKAQLTSSIISAFQADARFSNIHKIHISNITDNNASGLLVQLVVRLAGTGTAIPISFTINPG